MIKIKTIFFAILLIFNFPLISNSQNVPDSFADLAEKLMPSVVNISTTQTIVTKNNPFPGFEFPPGSPFGDMFKEFGTPQERQSSALGSGFIIEGILYAVFPSKMKNMLKKLELIKDSQLRTGGLIFAITGFFIIYYVKN